MTLNPALISHLIERFVDKLVFLAGKLISYAALFSNPQFICLGVIKIVALASDKKPLSHFTGGKRQSEAIFPGFNQLRRDHRGVWLCSSHL